MASGQIKIRLKCIYDSCIIYIQAYIIVGPIYIIMNTLHTRNLKYQPNISVILPLDFNSAKIQKSQEVLLVK